MDVSVVIPTLNGRELLARSLDALTDHAAEAEVVVVNGPSTDGTTGMVQDRDDVDVLIEIAARNINVARNAGIRAATGDVVAFLDHDHRIEDGWYDAIESALTATADVVTGPTKAQLQAGVTVDEPEQRSIAGREVTYLNPGNVAFTRRSLLAIDGFDEYLQTGGARDAAHRLAGQHRRVTWSGAMGVRHEVGTDGGAVLRDDPGGEGYDWGWKYRSLAYRLVKNYWLRPTASLRVGKHALMDGVEAARKVAIGDGSASEWVQNGRTVLENIAVGHKDGVLAWVNDRSPRRNPHGLSRRRERPVATYDWRE